MNKIKLFIYTILSIVVVFFDSCTIESYATKKMYADNEISAYMSENQIAIKKNESGLVYILLESGVGGYPAKGDKVAFHYKGFFMDGTEFDSSYEKLRPLIVKLGDNQMIKGLEEAVMLMNKGAKAKVLIPFYLAYNDLENDVIPPYSNLIFEIELIDFIKDGN